MIKPRKARAFAAGLSGSLGVIFILSGSLLTMGQKAVFDSDYFAAHVAESLGDERVASYVGEILTDAVVEGNQDLILVRPLISTTAKAIVASTPFQAVVARSVKRGHQLLATEGGHEVLLSVSDFGVILSNALAGQPEIAEKIPSDAVAVLGSIQDGPLVEISGQVIRFGQTIPFPPRLVFWLGMVLSIGAILLAVNRDLALLRSGVAITVTAAVILFIVKLGELILERSFADPELGGALAGIWETFMGGFWPRILILGGIGLLMSAAATAFLEVMKLDPIADRIRKLLIDPSDRTSVRLGRGIFLIAVGGAAVIEPRLASRVLVMFAGGVVCFLGLRELCRLLVDPAARLSRQADELTPPPRRQWMLIRRVGAGLAVAALLTAGAIYLTRQPAPLASVPGGGCNGSADLCDRPLDEIVFAGAHNAMGAADVPGWMFPNHQAGIPSQLRDGIRAFMLDVMSGVPVGDVVKTDMEEGEASRAKLEPSLGVEGLDAALRIRERLIGGDESQRDLYLCHGFCELGSSRLIPVLVQFRDFLVLNPGEVIIIIFEDTVPPSAVARAFEESGLVDLVYRGAVQSPWPTLGEMVRTNQRILVLAENHSEGVSWYHPAFEVCQETPYHFSSPDDFTCRPNRG
ncbi:MAG: hypothetical protein KAH56_08915, partial [Candidatus Krumholzibacteria bacterium]|nr:hypothetical protein [Candidatus Krumholzibacteria bacterium]